MKKITYNFLTGLKELSKKYNFDGFIDVELSPSSFKPHSYYTEFYIHIDAEDFTAQVYPDTNSRVLKLKKAIFKAYLDQTKDFRTSIFGEK